MGMNHAGEIDYLTRIARPGVALVNNAHRAHVGLLGDVAAVARAKGEIYAGLDDSGIALVNVDDAFAGYWKGLNTGRRVVTFGLAPSADVHAIKTGDRPLFSSSEPASEKRGLSPVLIVTPVDAFALTLQVPGDHNLLNAVAACAAAHALEIPPRAIQAGLAGFAGVAGRLQRRQGAQGLTVIDDTYNANPESMKAAIAVLAREPGRRVFAMGDMGELGDEAPAMHAEVGTYARTMGVDRLLAVGPESVNAVKAFGAEGRHFPTVEALLEEAARERGPATILVKGSRFMRMERVAEALARGGADAA
jgi:UDP-N-acetylmuramoyl-tripeptide--D-alanyl-D-alanine ligase